MPSFNSIRTQSYWFLAVSLLSLGMLPMITFGSNIYLPISTQQTQLVGVVFIIICTLGAIAGVRPSSCARSTSIDKGYSERIDDTKALDGSTQQLQKRGHHYECDSYTAHVISIQDKVYCAGCTGLTIGAVAAIIGSLLYFFSGILLENVAIVFWIGFSGVAVGLLQHPIYRVLRIKYGFFRVGINSFFVIGAFLLLASVIQLTSDFAAAVYLLFIILFWISTRIIMSKSEHDRICSSCDEIACGAK